MQLAVTAFASIRCGVGNILPAACPCGIVTLRAEQRHKFLARSGVPHTLIDHAHQLELPALALDCRVVFRIGHSARLPLAIPLEFRQPQFFTDLVVANAQRLNLLVRYMNLFSSLEIHAVDDAVRVDVFTVGMRTDQHLAALEISSEPACCFVRCARINVRTFREALHHVVEHHAAVFVVQQLRTQEFIECCFWLAADPANELLTVPEGLARLRYISHHAFHAAACLRTLFVVHEMDDCDFATPPSCISRRDVLILENSCIQHNLELAIDAAKALQGKSAYQNLGLSEEEIASWQTLHDAIIWPHDPDSGHLAQDETFHLLEPVDLAALKPDLGASYHHVCFDRLQRYKVVKQADVLLFMTRLPELFTKEEKMQAWNDFEPLCLHDSTLSFASHALFALQNGLREKGIEYLRKALLLDLRDLMNNTGKEGLHLAGMGEGWQAACLL